MTGNHIVGLDIGGANIKAAHLDGVTVSQPFPLWKEPDQLPFVLSEILNSLPPVDRLAVTMTGELADCYETKWEGVSSILDAVEIAAEGRQVDVWQTGGEFVDAEFAVEFPLLVAAANWHALATWVGQTNPSKQALLIDIGSTTTDLIPIENGLPATIGLTDVERLRSGELVYAGVRRTPVMALAQEVPMGDGLIPLAAEQFATTYDLYLLSGDLPESKQETDTANGKPATKAAAQDRLCRMLCCDRTEFPTEQLDSMAAWLREQHLQRMQKALQQILNRCDKPISSVYLSGEGCFLADRLISAFPELKNAERLWLDQLFTPALSTAACAYAVAQLAASHG
ncbi:Hydantoinase/oxoprolinase [Polystyrenella longa]|uniref:Hydantoinase/oxoprolinase n=1 Tax=Polystyrenella longa TaxID=2528007 RepID=A0A518CGH4_9PLAN|nr:hydantoinase/oxoprolinase family protein [Polystyrenella longa]QDU78323.1 Hydantoinase/oxoprolinase [Polystyrenella longa]